MSNIYALQRFKWENLSAEEQQNLQRSVCTLLERPSAPGLYLKKMQGGDDLVWSFRVNDHKRVLFTYFREEDNTHIVLLAYYNNHDRYQESIFLRPGVVREKLRQYGFADTGLGVPPTQESTKEVGKIEAVPSAVPHVQILGPAVIFSEEQKEAVRISVPGVISGVAGSGKTLVTYAMIEQYASDPVWRSLYVTRSAELVLKARNDLDYSGVTNADTMTFADLKNRSQQRVPAVSTVLTQDDLTARCRNVRLPYKATELAKEIELIAVLASDPNQAVELYRNLGVDQSLITLPDHREQLIKVYLRLQEQMVKNNESLTITQPLEGLEPWDLIVVDEAQDFSLGELIQLYQIAKNRCIVYCYNQNQNIDRHTVHHIDALSLLRMHMSLHAQPLTVVELGGSYRCSPSVIKQAQYVRQAMLKICKTHKWNSKGLGERLYSLSTVVDQPVAWFQSAGSRFDLAKCQLVASPHIAIITSAAQKKQAQKKFEGKMVLTPQESKGLEFKHVVLYNPLSAPERKKTFEAIAAQLSSSTTSSKDLEVEHLYLAMNELFVSMTRSLESLWIVQKEEHSLKPLLAALEQPAGIRARFAVTAVKASVQEWYRYCERLCREGHIEVAKDLFTQYVEGQEGYQQTFADLMAAVAPSPCSIEQLPRSNTSTPLVSKESKETLPNTMKNDETLDEPREIIVEASTTAKHVVFSKTANSFQSDNTELWSAMKRQDHKLLETLLEQGKGYLDLEKLSYTGLTLLHHAVLYDDPRAFIALQRAGAYLTTLTARHENIFHLAAHTGSVRCLEIFYNNPCAKFLINSISSAGRIPLQEAVVANHRKAKILTLLLEAGSDISVVSAEGNQLMEMMIQSHWEEGCAILIEHIKKQLLVNHQLFGTLTPLQEAIRHKEYGSLILLLQADANLNVITVEGDSVLHLAVKAKWQEGLSLLIEVLDESTRYLLNATNDTESTPLHLALEQGADELAIALIQAGADLTVPNLEGNIALHLAVKNRLMNCFKQIIVRNPMHVLVRNRDNQTPFSIAIKEDKVAMVGLILQLTIPHLPVADQDMSFVSYCAKHNRHLMLQLLLRDSRFSPNGTPEEGDNSPLSHAVVAGHERSVQLLLRAGVAFGPQFPQLMVAAAETGQIDILNNFLQIPGINLEFRDSDKRTALSAAYEARELLCLKALVNAGARVDTPIVIGSKYSIIERAIMDQDRECVEILLKTPYKIQLDKLISFAQVYGSVDIRRIINVYLDKSLMSRLLHR